MQRRTLILAALGASLLPLGGCITNSMLDSVKHGERHEYTEEVSSILISADKKNIVFLGKTYHYVIDAPQKLISILASPLKPKIKAEFINARIAENNVFQCLLGLMNDQPLTDEEAMLAKSLGFENQAKDSSIEWMTVMSLEGKRYKANQAITAASPYKTNKPYKVTVSEPSPASVEAVLAAAATPVTLAADGVLILGGIVLFPITIPLGLLYFQSQFGYGR